MFEYDFEVRFTDIDYAGRVFYGEAFEYLHIAEEEWFDSMGFSIRTQREDLGLLFPIVEASAEYHAPMVFEDELRFRLTVPEIREKTFDVHAPCVFARSEEPAFTAELTRVCMDVPDERSREIPQTVRDELAQHVP